MKFAALISVFCFLFLTACGPQVYYDPRVSLYQKVMDQCAAENKFECQDKYDRMLVSSYQESITAVNFEPGF